MTTFNYSLLVNDPLADIISAPLGADADNPLRDADRGKILVMNTSGNWIIASEDDEIQGFLVSVEPWTVNDGFSFGSVQRNRRMEAEVGANQGETPMAVGDLVVADAQVARGTEGAAKVKTGTPSTYVWKCLRIISGTGVAGDKVLLDRVA